MAIRDTARIVGSIQDVDHLASLSDSPVNVLIVSDRSLYLMQNFGLTEVQNYDVYAKEFRPGGIFVSVSDEDPETEEIDDIARNYNLEVQPVSDIRPVLSMTGVRTGSNQTIATSTQTDVQLTTFDQLPADLVSYSSNVWTIHRTGRAIITASVYFDNHATGFRQLRIMRNGTVDILNRVKGGLGANTPVMLAYCPYLQSGDEIRFQCFQDSGGNLDLVYAPGSIYDIHISIIGY